MGVSLSAVHLSFYPPPPMDDEPQFEPEFTAEASLDDHGPPPHVYTSSFFSKSKHFVVSGGSFTNVNEAAPRGPFEGPSRSQCGLNALTLAQSYHTHRSYTTSAFFSNSKRLVVTGGNFTNINQAAPSSTPDFRVIPLGDLNLLHPIGPSSGSAVVSRRRKRATVRRMYSAQIHGSRSNMTAAVYQGDGAEEQWRAGISRYADIRHPYLFQLYGIASTGGLYAAFFHDDLIPHGEILEKYRGAHFPTVFFWACIDAQFCDVNQYMSSISGRYLQWAEYMVWIRPSTTQLCVELMAPAHAYLELGPIESGIQPSHISFSQIPEDSHIMASLSLQAYHEICFVHLAQRQNLSISTNDSVQVGSIRHFPDWEYETSFEIASAPDVLVYDRGWETEDHVVDNMWNRLNGDEEGTSILENGWIRCAFPTQHISFH
ncbi:hypothetical protein B0H19DRAFT_450554 [Mycena capillaripes]|nr:hypothetical protein B0H19DRAFT_450554 [Mycena capillaripes]